MSLARLGQLVTEGVEMPTTVQSKMSLGFATAFAIFTHALIEDDRR